MRTAKTDQSGLMPWLIRVFAGRTCHFAGFVMRWLILFYWDSLTDQYIWAASWQNQQNVWSESSLCAQWVATDPSFLQADAQADLSLRWVHMPFCWFCHEVAHLCNPLYLEAETALTWKWGLETHLASCLNKGHMTLVNSAGSITSKISSNSFRNITLSRKK